MNGPLSLAVDFWRPLLPEATFDTLAAVRPIDAPPVAGIHVVHGPDDPARHHVEVGDDRFFLFVSVHRIDEPPPQSRVLARITDEAGTTCSYVLWFPGQGRVLIPFNPDEAVDSLRRERYTAGRTTLPSGLLSAYYAIRPLLPKRARLLLRKAVAHGDAQPDHELAWPMDRSLDLLMELLLRAMMLALGVSSLPFSWFWPGAHPWATVLTHDVETAAGLRVVPGVMQAERARGLRSSFNFVPHDYETPDALLEELRAAGFEVGVHGWTHDGLLVSRWPLFLDRVEKINAVGQRWHAAGFRSPATYRNLDWFALLDFDYDSSVTDTAPYEPQPGGCASLFPYAVGDLIELPMTLPQDHTLFGILGHEDPRVWLDKLEAIRRCNGMACVLTHPEPGPGYIGDERNAEHYSAVLDFIADHNVWTPLPHELVQWWKERSRAPLGTFAVGGSAAEARLSDSGQLELVPPDGHGVGMEVPAQPSFAR